MSESMNHTELMAQKMDRQGELSCAATIRALVNLSVVSDKRIAELEQQLSTNDQLLLLKNAEVMELKQENRLLQQKGRDLQNTVNALTEALRTVASGTEDKYPPFRNCPASVLMKVAKNALAKTPAQHTAEHDKAVIEKAIQATEQQWGASSPAPFKGCQSDHLIEYANTLRQDKG